MAGGGGGEGRELDRTPTWAVALVVAIIIIISILLEKALHKVGQTFMKRKKEALVEALEKIKAELMILGFISLLLTFGQNYISKICIPQNLGDTLLPCNFAELYESKGNEPAAEHHRRLLWNEHRILAADSQGKSCKNGYVPLISVSGLHQIHIFIFFLAIFHVFYSAVTMTLGRLKIRGWKDWEKEIADNFDATNDPSAFRLTHETSFVKGHTSSWMSTPVIFYIVCFTRHILYSVRRADYLTLRNGFISVHLAPGTKFDFQKYIKRSLEDDFKVVVGIPPLLWGTTVLYLLMNVAGWHAMFWLSLIPLVTILAVGTKLQSIITRMAIEIQERHAVVQGIPLVQVSDRHFWFGRPTLILHLIHLTLFQNAFEITYFVWISYEFGFNSCFHDDFRLALLRVAIGVGVQFLCSYITLPLYALVTQMGSHMKRSIFDEQTSKALKSWHDKIKKKTDNHVVKPRAHTLGETPDPESPHESSLHRNNIAGSSAIQMTTGKRSPRGGDRDDLNALVDIPLENVPGHRNHHAGNRDLLTGP